MRYALSGMFLGVICSFVFAAEPILERDALLGDVYGFRDYLNDNGISVDFSVVQVYQTNVRGGLSTHNHRGRYSGRYDLEMNVDGEKVFGLENSSIYMDARGSWSDTGGIDATSVGSAFGVNGVANTDRAMDIFQLWFEKTFLDNKLTLRLGKIDLTCGFNCGECTVAFDSSAFANSECEQFLNGALVNNPTIPFPQSGLAIAALYAPTENFYISGGIADAQANMFDSGFETAFDDEDYYFVIGETGVITEFDSANGLLKGAYRVGLWYDPQPKANSDSSKNYRDDMGIYTSLDQQIYRENSEDNQGLGVFFRYGYAPSKTNDITNFVSAGMQYQGLFAERDDDVFGFGFAHGAFSDGASTTYPQDSETVYETYYSVVVTDAIKISPSLQYVTNPGGANTKDAVVMAVRFNLAF